MKKWYKWFFGLAGALLMVSPLMAQQMSKTQEQPMFGQGSTYAEIMKNDHKQVSSLIKQLGSTSDARQRKDTLAKLKDGLAKHMKAEENYLYPRLEKFPDAKPMAIRAEDEHMAAKAELAKLDPSKDEDVFTSRLEVLKNLINTHVDFEESQLIDKANQDLSGEQDKITQQFKLVY